MQMGMIPWMQLPWTRPLDYRFTNAILAPGPIPQLSQGLGRKTKRPNNTQKHPPAQIVLR